MSKQITLTVPDVVHEAMELKGRLFGLSASEWLKQKVLASAMGADVPLHLEGAVKEVRGGAARPALVSEAGELVLGEGAKAES